MSYLCKNKRNIGRSMGGMSERGERGNLLFQQWYIRFVRFYAKSYILCSPLLI